MRKAELKPTYPTPNAFGSPHLTSEQQLAVNHHEGPLLVLAGAGSGKTLCIAARIERLINVHRVRPENILALTFTKKAAEELRQRVTKSLSSGNAMAEPLIGTFHSIFLRILRSNGFKDYRIVVDKARETAFRTMLTQLGRHNDIKNTDYLLGRVSFRQGTSLPGDTERDDIADLTRSFKDFKEQHKLLDFDDIITRSYELLSNNPRLWQRVREQFRYISVDEVQDLSPVQYSLIRLISAPLQNLAVYGDDCQTIYGFRGSRVSLILDFEKDFPGTRVVTLTVNHRSPQSIVNLAQSVILKNHNQRHKEQHALSDLPDAIEHSRVSDSEAEAQYIVKQIRTLQRPLRNMCVLYRTHTAVRALVDKLVAEDIPFVYHGQTESFYEQPCVVRLLAYLRLAMDPDDREALTSILPTLYLNTAAIKHVVAEQGRLPDKHLLELLATIPDLKEYHTELIVKRIALISSLHSQNPLSAIRLIRSQQGGQYDKFLGLGNSDSAQTESIKDTLNSLEEAAASHLTIAELLSHVDEVVERQQRMREKSADSGFAAVSLMSIHAAKGKEYPVVFLIGCSEGILPHRNAFDPVLCAEILQTVDEAVEEECRLAYVAITRAQQKLYITSPREYHGKPVEASRFFLGAFSHYGRKEEI